MSPEDEERAVNDAATALANQLAGFLNHSNVSCAVAITALAKLLGQGAARFGGPLPDSLLEAACNHARQEMRLRRVGDRLHAAGLGAIMPMGQP
jgi:hypothetical protein